MSAVVSIAILIVCVFLNVVLNKLNIRKLVFELTRDSTRFNPLWVSGSIHLQVNASWTIVLQGSDIKELIGLFKSFSPSNFAFCLKRKRNLSCWVE